MTGRSARPLTVRTTLVDRIQHLTAHLPDAGGVAWLRDGDGFVGSGEAIRVDLGTGPGRFDRAADAMRTITSGIEVERNDIAAPAGGLLAAASFTFDGTDHGSVLIVPRLVLRRGAGRTWVTTVTPAGEQPADPPAPVRTGPERRDRVRFAGSSVPDVDWLEAVARTTRRIERDDRLDKVVLARDHAVWSKTPFSAPRLARHLVDHFPDCFTFVCDGLVGATPELLLRRRGPHVSSLALAGSVGRAEDPAADDALGRKLLGSDKDRREHDFTVASVRDVLAPRCADLEVDTEPSLLRFENVQHLATRLDGTLDESTGSLELLAALHPTAAVAGVPRGAAIAAIRELEGMDRGRYAGPVGWVDATGDGEWGIALRCARLSGARARLFAGAGIVAGSLPEAELEETRLKLKAMQGALASEVSGR